MFRWLKKSPVAPIEAGPPGEGRSPQWDAFRTKFIKANPVCAACGANRGIEAHHVEPFHVRPDLELVAANLIALCRPCHFCIGHGNNWSNWRPDCRKLARQAMDTPISGKE